MGVLWQYVKIIYLDENLGNYLYMPQFFVSLTNIQDNLIKIDDKETFHHLTRALRVRVGESLKVIDENEIVYQTEIKEINSKELILKIISSKKSERKLGFNLTLAQAILHSDAQNFVIQKATELGVSNIIPVIMDNCAIKKDVAEKKSEKWQKIAQEAFKQCERANVPLISNIVKLMEIDFSQYDKIIVCSEIEKEKTLKHCNVEKAQNILLIIGPEGGFSNKEFEFFKEKNFDTISLGNLILKAETAVISAISTLIYEKENG